MPKKFPSNDSVASGETNGIENGSLSSGTLDLLHSPEKKYSHVCVVTYCTKENVVIGVDVSKDVFFALQSYLGCNLDLHLLVAIIYFMEDFK